MTFCIISDLWLCVCSVRTVGNLEHHGAVAGEVVGHLLHHQEHDQPRQDEHHQGCPVDHVDSSYHCWHSPSLRMEQICL